MKNIELLGTFDLEKVPPGEKQKEVSEIVNASRRRILVINLRGGETLARHKAFEPITVFCLAGQGTFRAGTDLAEEQKLSAGMLITLEPEIEHEVTAEPEISILVTRFKQQ